MSGQSRNDRCTHALVAARTKYCQNFDTELACNCGKATITDHASGANPNAHQLVLGSTPTPQSLLDNFTVYHQYYCDACGAIYMASVIEGVRNYVPLEKRDPLLPPTH